MGGIRAAKRADRRRAIASLSDAFRGDPAIRFMFPDDRERAKRLPRLFSLLCDDEAVAMRLVSYEAAAVTLWHPPGASDQGRDLGLLYKLRGLWIFGPALSRGRLMGETIHAHSPNKPFWYRRMRQGGAG